jgi:hypothetical protein
MRRAGATQSFEQNIAELEAQGIPYDRKQVWDISKKQGLSEGLTEAGSDVIQIGAVKALAKVIPGGTVATTLGSTFLKTLFEPSGKELLKSFGKAYATSAVAESSSEVANLAIQQKLGESLGLENKFANEWVDTAGTSLVMSGMFVGVGGTITHSSRKAALNDIKDTLFNGVQDASQLTPEQQNAYIEKRLKVASELVPVIKQNLGDDAALNFMRHVTEATKTAIDPTRPATRPETSKRVKNIF